MRTLKRRLRDEGTEHRARMSPFAREQAAANLAEWIYAAPFRLEYDVTVAAYVPVGSEPGSLAMLDALLDRGVTVLIPVVPPGEPDRLDWARYTGQQSLTRGRWGLWEPTGSRLGAEAIRAASVILVPALAVDKSGVRLGRGGGYYDRTLTGLTADVVAVIYDDELVDSLPAGPYDVPVGWVLTPEGGFGALG
ncbi:5-formyltetrahydrofolate cyclo-ligase [Gordonia sp. ABSL49_1]|uniref:5-formyltetrahydrofolate cyclo-ligase n=1 Tax=Gordonia sp. ABSL49_1 TaxID=2920941 RepID=UPI001F0DBCEB|nr:5-formyltetrahydrofolate cyclo-ligase [Gordonia sp. ABSL49_1]MCH5641901.1 5-formyltetrahydrofolate cyclo-ligase [Gordonia sp. ABSL49_1]